MADNPSLKEKLEKLSVKKPTETKSRPILKAKRPDDIEKLKVERKTAQPPVPQIPIPMPKGGEKKEAPDIDSIITKSEIDEMVSKIESELDLKPQRAEKTEQRTIRSFEIPSTEEIKGVIGLAATLDETGEKRLSQLLYIKSEPEAEPQWTVMRDQSAEEFAMIVKEGLRQFKTKPLVYGMEFEEGVILASHRDGFTFTLACYELEIGNMLQIFISIVGYIEKNT